MIAERPHLRTREPATVHIEAKGTVPAFDYTFQSMSPDDEDVWLGLIERATSPSEHNRYKVFGVFYPDSESANHGRFFWSDTVIHPIHLINATARKLVEKSVEEVEKDEKQLVDNLPPVPPTVFEIRQRLGEAVPSVIFWASESSQARRLGDYFRTFIREDICIVEDPSY